VAFPGGCVVEESTTETSHLEICDINSNRFVIAMLIIDSVQSFVELNKITDVSCYTIKQSHNC